MIISRTPFRISFFGGGTDYPAWFQEHGGAALSTTIDKYCYISIRPLPPFFQHRHRIVYSKIELVRELEEIQHPVVRECLRKFAINHGLEIHHDADLPARSGLGSSSAFTVGMLQNLYAYQGRIVTKKQLAREAIHMEQVEIGETVGVQDQISTSYGGLNKLAFRQDGTFDTEPVILTQERLDEFNASLLLVFTGQTRFASDVAKKKIVNLKHRVQELTAMQAMVEEGSAILNDVNQSIDRFGALLNESWMFKRTLSDVVTTPQIDEIYAAAIAAGASGGKLLGAGAGGFMVFIVKPALRNKVKEALSKLIHVHCRIEHEGSKILVYEPHIIHS